MRRSQKVGLGLAIAAIAALSVMCGGDSHGGGAHGDAAHGGAEVTALPPPTPDTTPIEALRTPAGLVLKIDTGTTPTVVPTATTPTPTPTK